MLELNPDLPIVYDRAGRAIKPKTMVAFFRYGFAPTEEKYRVIFLMLASTGARVSEIAAVRLQDFLPDSNFTRFHMKVEKKIKSNFIAIRVLPEATAAFVRKWIKDNWTWITSKQGYLFPAVNNRSVHIRANNIETWLGKKRKQLHQLFPKLGFMDIDGYANYSKPKLNHYTGQMETTKPMYRFCCHAFRHFYATHISPDPEKAQQILRHDDVKTTLRYRKEADLLEIESKLTNELFNAQFLDAVSKPGEDLVAVWDDLKQYGKPTQ